MKNPCAAISLLAFGGVLMLGAISARAEHFDIALIVRTSKGQADAGWDTAPPDGGLNERRSVSAAVGEDIELEWRMRSEFPHGTMKNVTVHLFVVPEAQIGQKELPHPDTPRLVNNRFTADYLPHHQAKGLLHFRVTQPGNYLVRIESELTIKEHGHEHFGAVDLKVE
ncbi:MAG: hypothetical protein ACO1SX_15480 [Actinomycetota bacterium]